MHDYSYSAHLVINDGYEDRLDITITCQNAQQLLRAKDLIADQMNAYIAEFAVQSGLTGVPSNAEQNAAALQAVIQEQTEKAKQQEPEEPAEPEPPEIAPDEPEESPPSHDDALDAVCYRPDLASFKLVPTETPQKAAAPAGAKGLMRLKCPKCGDVFVAFTKDYRTEWTCKVCGERFSLETPRCLNTTAAAVGTLTDGQTSRMQILAIPAAIAARRPPSNGTPKPKIHGVMQMPASDDDREMMARFNDTFRKLKTNREQVPLEVLQTKYGKAYQKLTKEMANLADWFAARLRERMPFPMHPKDIAGNRQLSQQIAAVLAEESQPGALMDQYRKALIDDLDYDKFLDLVWQLYHRTEEAYEPYWQKYNFWHVYPDGHRWIRNHITGFFWQNGQPGNDSDSFTNEGGYWIDSKGEYQGAAFPPHIKGDKIWTKKN